MHSSTSRAPAVGNGVRQEIAPLRCDRQFTSIFRTFSLHEQVDGRGQVDGEGDGGVATRPLLELKRTFLLVSLDVSIHAIVRPDTQYSAGVVQDTRLVPLQISGRLCTMGVLEKVGNLHELFSQVMTLPPISRSWLCFSCSPNKNPPEMLRTPPETDRAPLSSIS